jgi:hypothetical protein
MCFSSSCIQLAAGDKTSSCALHREESTAFALPFVHVHRAGVGKGRCCRWKSGADFRIRGSRLISGSVRSGVPKPGASSDRSSSAAEPTRFLYLRLSVCFGEKVRVTGLGPECVKTRQRCALWRFLVFLRLSGAHVSRGVAQHGAANFRVFSPRMSAEWA